MPREKVYVVVSDSSLNARADTDVTHAFEAGRWLAYADQTDTIGYESFVKDAHHNDRETRIAFEIPILRGQEREAFIDELEKLSRVERFDFGDVR